MEIFQPDSKFTLHGQRPVITIGSFDGLHLGHQKIIKHLKTRAADLKTVSGIITFSPLPIVYFSPTFTYLLTTEVERNLLFEASAVDFVYYFRFDKTFAQLSPQAFVRKMKEVFDPRAIIVGQNHRFGNDRQGDIRILKKLAREYFVSVRAISPKMSSRTKISSTAIREALLLGHITLANRMLGREYSVQGVVVKGAGRGRGLGFPTINIEISHPKSIDDRHKLIPLDGVYITKVVIADQAVPGVMSIGRQPTFEEVDSSDERRLEVHLLDFDRNIYDEKVRVLFIRRLRPIKRFHNQLALAEVIREDVKKTRMYFRTIS